MSVHTVRPTASAVEQWDLLAWIWAELRSSHMISGQPRGEKSCEGILLAQKALSIASTTTDSALQAEAHRMMAYALNGNEQYEDSIHHYEVALKSLDATTGKEDLAARTRLGLIGALLMHGLQPGPLLFRNRPDLVATIVALVFMASLATLAWGLIGARVLAKILKIRDQYLWATVLAVALGGSYALNQSTGDVWTALTAGVLGFLLRQQGFPMGPLVLALILGPMAESNLRRALALSEGSLATFVTRPISLLFLVLAALTLLWPLISRRGAADSRLPDSSIPDSDTL